MTAQLDLVDFVTNNESEEVFLKAIQTSFKSAMRCINTGKDTYTEYHWLMHKARFPNGKLVKIFQETEKLSDQAAMWLRNNYPIESWIYKLKGEAIANNRKTIVFQRHLRIPDIEEA